VSLNGADYVSLAELHEKRRNDHKNITSREGNEFEVNKFTVFFSIRTQFLLSQTAFLGIGMQFLPLQTKFSSLQTQFALPFTQFPSIQSNKYSPVTAF
jgi:hypothetical protein